VRLWFWLDRPLGEAELTAWLGDLKSDDGLAVVDVSVFRTVQPIYTAIPVFEEGRADHLPTRMARIEGAPTVEVPHIEVSEKAERKARQARPQTDDDSEGEGEGEDEAPISAEHAEHIIRKALARLTDCEDGRKRDVLNSVAYTLGGFMTHKGWTEDQTVEMLMGCLQGKNVKSWEDARKTAHEGLRDGARRPYVVVDSATPEFGALDDEPGTEQAEQAKAEQAKSEADLILSPSSPTHSAREFMRRRFMAGGQPTMHHQGSVFYRWGSTHYEEAATEEVRAQIYAFLDSAKRVTKEKGEGGTEKNKLVPFHPKRNAVGDVIEALRGTAQLPGSIRAPAWLGDGTDRPTAVEMLSCKNGLLHLPTRALLAHTPQFFSPIALNYAYDPDAPEPSQWLKFLASVWPDDPELITVLQELFGLLLTSETKHQKIFLIIGPKRSGKGTIARVLTALIGRENVCNPTLASLGQNFGLSPLIGKPLAIIGDARLGGRGTDVKVVGERLLSISGEDGLTIDRKHRDLWTGTLPTRFVVLTNELPGLTDASGALAGRFIILPMERSFYGREDHGLFNRLLPELPGIFNWALAGLDRLNSRGHFVQPRAGLEQVEALEDLASPVGAFVKQRCVLGAKHTVDRDALFTAWTAWCAGQGRHPGTSAMFGRDLKAVVADLKPERPRDGGTRQNLYRGVGLAGGVAGDAAAPLF
jgi:putative DNA primase/helicase